MKMKVAGEYAVQRLEKQVYYRSRNMVGADGTVPPSRLQIAAVLHALADHTAIMEALKHRPPADGLWPEATSVGRWLHDLGDEFEAEL